MKKIFFCAVLIFSLFLNGKSQSKSSLPLSSDELRHWVYEHFAQGKIPPFSFEYGGKNSEKFKICFAIALGQNSLSVDSPQV